MKNDQAHVKCSDAMIINEWLWLIKVALEQILLKKGFSILPYSVRIIPHFYSIMYHQAPLELMTFYD